MSVLADRDPKLYQEIQVHNLQISDTGLLIELLSEMLSHRAETPYHNYRIRSKINSIRNQPMYKDTTNPFESVYDSLDSLILLWRDSRTLYPYWDFIDGKQEMVGRHYYYLIRMWKLQLEQTIVQVRDQDKWQLKRSLSRNEV